MKVNNSPARCSSQHALKQTSHTPGVGKGQNNDNPRGGVVTNIELKTYKVISKSPRG